MFRTPYHSSQPSSSKPKASLTGEPAHREEAARNPDALSQHFARPWAPSLRCPVTHWGWPRALCQEGDWYWRCFHLLCVIPREWAGFSSGRGHPRKRLANRLLLRFRSISCICTSSLSPSFPHRSGAKRMLLRTRHSCAQIWGKGGFEKPPLAPQGLRGWPGSRTLNPACNHAALALSFGNFLLGWLLIRTVSERGAQMVYGAVGPRLALLKEL